MILTVPRLFSQIANTLCKFHETPFIFILNKKILIKIKINGTTFRNSHCFRYD